VQYDRTVEVSKVTKMQFQLTRATSLESSRLQGLSSVFIIFLLYLFTEIKEELEKLKTAQSIN